MAEISESKQFVQQFERQFSNDEPIIFNEITVYPISVKDAYDFFMSSNIISIEKNQIKADPLTMVKIIGMSYLDFIFWLIENDPNGEYYSFMFVQLLKQCLHIDADEIRYKRNEQGKIDLFLSLYVDAVLNEEDFLYKVFDSTQIEEFEKQDISILEKIKNEEIASISEICNISLESVLLLIDTYKRCESNFKTEKQIQVYKDFFDQIRWIILY